MTHPSHFLQYCIRLSYPDLYKTHSNYNHSISSHHILIGLSTILSYHLAMSTRLMVSRSLCSIWKNRGISRKAYPGCSVNVELFLVAHRFVTTQANNDRCTCFTMAGCHTVMTPIEKQSGQQVLYACHLLYLSEWVEDIMLSNQYTTCSTTV